MDEFEADVAVLHGKFIEAAESVAEKGDMSFRMEVSFLVGAYMVANAIDDLRLVLEGPDCTYMKQQFFVGNHDMMSTINSVSGLHRVVTSDVHVDTMHEDREGGIQDLLFRVTNQPSSTAVVITSMPMAMITGADYDGLCNGVSEATGKPVFHVKGRSLRADWMDGYSDMLHHIAKQLELPECETTPEDIAIVGHLFDRNECDQQANIAEYHEIAEALGLNLRSVWLSGQNYGDLSKVAEAGTIICLPYASKAARFIARRTGARVINMPLPFGLTATEAWVRQLGEEFGRTAEAEAYIDRNLSEIIPRLEWLIPFLFQNAKIGYVGDPHLYPGFVEILELLGSKLAFTVFTNRAHHLRRIKKLLEGVDYIAYPREKAYKGFVHERLRRERVQLIVSNSQGLNILWDQTGFMEFGFPSNYSHALYAKPFLGFHGFAAFVTDMANTMRKAEVDAVRAKSLRSEIAAMKEERPATPVVESIHANTIRAEIAAMKES